MLTFLVDQNSYLFLLYKEQQQDMLYLQILKFDKYKGPHYEYMYGKSI
jgi:hypothetical protein